MTIYFTKHAQEKFSLLEKHGVIILKKIVESTVIKPEKIDSSRLPLLIAQASLNKSHVLRVVYKIEMRVIKIITFYPGRKTQYDKQKNKN